MRSQNHLPAGGRLAATQPAGPLEGWGRAKAAGAVRQRLQQQEARSPKVSFVTVPPTLIPRLPGFKSQMLPRFRLDRDTEASAEEGS